MSKNNNQKEQTYALKFREFFESNNDIICNEFVSESKLFIKSEGDVRLFQLRKSETPQIRVSFRLYNKELRAKIVKDYQSSYTIFSNSDEYGIDEIIDKGILNFIDTLKTNYILDGDLQAYEKEKEGTMSVINLLGEDPSERYQNLNDYWSNKLTNNQKKYQNNLRVMIIVYWLSLLRIQELLKKSDYKNTEDPIRF